MTRRGQPPLIQQVEQERADHRRVDLAGRNPSPLDELAHAAHVGVYRVVGAPARCRPVLWQKDLEAARGALGASISLLLRLIGRDPDPVRSRDHAVLSVLAERRLRDGETAGVRELLEEIRNPSLTETSTKPKAAKNSQNVRQRTALNAATTLLFSAGSERAA